MKHNDKKLLNLGKILVVFLFLGGVLSSCSKDKNEEDGVNRSDFERNHFNIQAGDFHGRPMPSSNSTSLEISNITGNSTVLAGGSNNIRVTAGEGATEVVIGVQDRDGFFSVPLQSSGNNATGETMEGVGASIQLLVGQNVNENFVIAFAAGDGQGNYSVYQYLPVNIMEVGVGLLRVSVSWDQMNDVDLHLIDPNGEEIYYGRDTSSTGGQLDLDSNAGCSIDGVNNENIFYDDSPEVTIPYGEYEVLVDLWSNCSVPENTLYTVRAYYGGEEITPTVGNSPHNGILTPADESFNSNPISVMKFNIDGPPASRSNVNESIESLPKIFQFRHDKNNKVFMKFNSKKK